MVTRPPLKAKFFPYFASKRESSSSSAARGSATMIRRKARRRLRSRYIVVLPQHVLQGLLLVGVHRQQLLAEVCVLSVTLDVRLAFSNGVIEEHQFFFVRDHQRRLGVLELRLGEPLQFFDGGDVRPFG